MTRFSAGSCLIAHSEPDKLLWSRRWETMVSDYDILVVFLLAPLLVELLGVYIAYRLGISKTEADAA